MIIALTPTRQESWILPFSVRAALMWCDKVVLLNHCGSPSDYTITELINEYPDRIHVIAENDPDWNEADYRQRLLEFGRELGGTHFALIDADECLTGNLILDIMGMAANLKPGQCLKLPWICLWRSIYQYRKDESTFGRAHAAVVFADAKNLSHRTMDGGYQLHTRVPNGAFIVDELDREDGGLMHFQHVRWKCLLRKQLLYQMQEAVRWPGRSTPEKIAEKYRRTVDETGLILGDVPRDWMAAYWHLLHHLDLTDHSWHEREVYRMLQVHGYRKFDGLDLFGFNP